MKVVIQLMRSQVDSDRTAASWSSQRSSILTAHYSLLLTGTLLAISLLYRLDFCNSPMVQKHQAVTYKG